MKRIKKMLSIMLTMAMALTMSVTAFGAITPEGTETSHTYQIYQIFTGDYSDGVLSNIKWGVNGKGTVGAEVPADVLEALEAVSDNAANTDTAQLAVISGNVNLDSDPIATGNTTKYTGLTPGYYLVRDMPGTQTGDNASYTLYVVQVVNDTLEFTPKSGVPTSDKDIVSADGTLHKFNEAAIGDTITYQLTGTLPDRFADYKTYYYVFTDTLSKGLTYDGNNTVTVKVVDKDGNDKLVATPYFWKGYTAKQDGSTEIKIGIQDLKTLNNLDDFEFVETDKIIVTYTATLNKNAVIAGDGNLNDVQLKYTNNPNDSGEGTTEPPTETPDEPNPVHPTGDTPKKEVRTYTTELAILKTNENGEVLADAEFTLTGGDNTKITIVTSEEFVEDSEGAYWKLKNGSYTMTAPVTEDTETQKNNVDDYESITQKYSLQTRVIEDTNVGQTNVTVAVGTDGRIVFTGLGTGTYTLTESKTPAGYNTIKPITFTINFANKVFSVDPQDKINLGENNTLQADIINQSGSTLPETGGIGTTIFYIVGAILVVGAAILLVTKKRMSKEA